LIRTGANSFRPSASNGNVTGFVRTEVAAVASYGPRPLFGWGEHEAKRVLDVLRESPVVFVHALTVDALTPAMNWRFRDAYYRFWDSYERLGSAGWPRSTSTTLSALAITGSSDSARTRLRR
jgi:hypothetical protein